MKLPNNSKPPLIFIVGPTASGKSAVALKLAQEFGGEIINGDSLQVYRSLNIGTAKPSLEERSLLPHHLFGHVADGATYTAGDYRREALNVLSTAKPDLAAIDLCESDRCDTPKIVVGGSGFYIQALEKGMFEVPEVPENIINELRLRAQDEGYGILYQELESKDPEAARGIKPQDSYRILRALGVMSVQPKKISEIRSEFECHRDKLEDSYQVLKIGITQERPVLRDRIEQRLQQMHNAKWLQEIETLLKNGLKDWSPLKSVGYKEMLDWISGDLTPDERDALIIQNTMRLAKRQMTWFRRDQNIHWLLGKKVETDASAVVNNYFKGKLS